MRSKSWLVVLLALGALQGGCAVAKEASSPSAMSGGMARPESVDSVAATAPMAPPAPADERQAANTPFAASPPPPPPPPPPGQAPADKKAAGGESAKPEPTSAPARDSQMIVYTATITMAVYQVQPNLVQVERIAKEQGGYLSLRNDNQITVRVPREKFEHALGLIEKIGDVLHRDVSAEDVTDQYTDLDIRIKNARAMQTRLKQLLEKAAVKEAIDIERELARVTQELELMEGKLKLLKDKIAYSTITVAFQARGAALQGASAVKLPFPWLGRLGLVNLLQLREERAQ